MNTQNPPELAPQFEAVLLLHDGIMGSLAQIRPDRLLPAPAMRNILLESERYPYTQLTQPNGRPYMQVPQDGVLKRYYIFADPEEIDNPVRMVAMECDVEMDRSGVIKVMPSRLMRGAEADVFMSVKFGCCSPGSRTVIYSDTSQTQGVFVNMSSSGNDVRSEIRAIWNNLKVTVLDDKGAAALHHLVMDMSGRCGSGHASHAARADYGRGASFSGIKKTATPS